MDEFLSLSSEDKVKYILEKDSNGNYIHSEQERIELSQELFTQYLEPVVLSLSDKNKLVDSIFKRYDYKKLGKSFTDIEAFKELLSKYDNVFVKVELINDSSFDLKTKIDLMDCLPINSRGELLYKIKDQLDDDLCIRLLDKFVSTSKLVDIILLIKDEDKRCEQGKRFKSVLEERYRLKVFESLSVQKQIESFVDYDLSSKSCVFDIVKNNISKYPDSFRDEEKFFFAKYLNGDSFSLNQLYLSLSDEGKASDIVYSIINDSVSYYTTIVSSIKDPNILERVLKKNYDNPYVVNQILDRATISDESLVKFLKYLNHDGYIVDRVEKIKNDNLLQEALEYVNDEHHKAFIIRLMESIDKRIELGKKLSKSNIRNIVIKSFPYDKQIEHIRDLNLDDSDIQMILTTQDKDGNFLLSDEKKIELLPIITDHNSRDMVVCTLKDENKVSDTVLSMYNRDEFFTITRSIKDFKSLSKAFDFYSNDRGKGSILKNYNYSDEVKYLLLNKISDVYERFNVVQTIQDQQYIIKSLDYLDDNYYNLATTLRITDEELKIKYLKEHLSKYDDYEKFMRIVIFRKVDISNYQDLLKDFHEKLLSEEDAIIKTTNENEFIKMYNNLSYKSSKDRVLKSITNDSLKLQLISERDSNNNLILNEEERLDIMLTMRDEECAINAYFKAPFEDESRRLALLVHFSEVNKYNYLGILEDDRDKMYILNSIDDVELIKKAIEKYNTNDIIKNLFEEGDYKFISSLGNIFYKDYLDSKQLLVINEYLKIVDSGLAERFSSYVHNNYDAISEEKISKIAELIFKVNTSNSDEVSKQGDSFVLNILSSNDPIETFNKVENVFLKNHLPYFVKQYLTFLTVHPDFESYRFKGDKYGGHEVSSPVLNDYSLLHTKIIVLNDLMRCALGSNSYDLLSYLNRLEIANNLYLDYKNNPRLLTDDETKLLTDFRDSLYTIYDNTLYKQVIDKTNDVLNDISKMEKVFSADNENNISLADRVIHSYFHFIGLNSIEEVRNCMKLIHDDANNKGVNRTDFTINKGDFIKGFDINYFNQMIENGIVAHDYLGANMNTDMTALDTDLSRVWKDTTGMTNNEIIDLKNRDSGMYGQAYIIIKDDPNKINITAKSDNEPDSRVDVLDKKTIFSNKLEAFSNGSRSLVSDPYGIRTGFASSDIDYIIYDEQGGKYEDNIYKLIIPMVKNGLYIPILAKQDNRVLFSVDDYNRLRQKMDGLTRYGINSYNISNNIDAPVYEEIASQIDDSTNMIRGIKTKIIQTINEGLGNKYNIIQYINGKLDKNELQILDTGSTSRSSNIPYDGDFDFIIRINREEDVNPTLKQEFIKNVISKFDIVDSGKIVDGDIKGMIVRIDGNEYPLDLSFTLKTDKVSYSTEMCVSDRLNTIQNLYPDKYELVLANIIYAKKYLKENGCYKKGSFGQGGLGGIGVENWILQNGGSFYDAAKSFVSNAFYENGTKKDFNAFIKDYSIWDFGENFYTDRRNRQKGYNYSLHDNFVKNNMTPEGFDKMTDALKKFVNDYDKFINMSEQSINQNK